MATRKIKSYDVNRHSCFKVKYHLVLTTSGNEEVFTPDLESYLNDFITSMLTKNECKLQEIRYDGIHVHILFDGSITLNIPNFVNGMKSTSSRMLRRKYEDRLNQFVGVDGFWLRYYLLLSQSEDNEAVIYEYIKNEIKR